MKNAAATIIPILALMGLLGFLAIVFWDVGADPVPAANQVQLPSELKAKTLGELAVGEEMKSHATWITVDSKGFCWVKPYGEPADDGDIVFKRTKEGFEVTLLKPHAWTYAMKDGLAFSKRTLVPVTKLEKKYGN